MVAKKMGRPKKKGRPKGATVEKKESKVVIEALQSQISTLQTAAIIQERALDIFIRFEGMLFALADKVRILEESK